MSLGLAPDSATDYGHSGHSSRAMRTHPRSQNGRPWRGRGGAASFLFAASMTLFAGAVGLGGWGVVGCTHATSAGFGEETEGGSERDATATTVSGDAGTMPSGPLFGNEGGATGSLAVTPSSATVDEVKPGPDATQNLQGKGGRDEHRRQLVHRQPHPRDHRRQRRLHGLGQRRGHGDGHRPRREHERDGDPDRAPEAHGQPGERGGGDADHTHCRRSRRHGVPVAVPL